MKAGLLLPTLLAIATTSVAAPTLSSLGTRSVSSSHGRRQISPQCDLSALDNVTLPITGSTLPAPAEDFFLAAIVVGRGVQNYTCGNDSSAAPVSNGAVAVLYEASCIGVENPDLLASLPGSALQISLPEDPEGDLDCGSQPLERAGHHFFNAAKVPTFDFRETADPQLGLGMMGVGVKFAAPNAGTDVPWLSLNRVDGSEGPIQAIYRLNTAGGQPPATCEGQQPEISVQYASQYWVFSKDA